MAWPTGDTLPGPCQAVRTPNISQQQAIFRARLKPPIAEMWMRMKSIQRFATSGSHSFRLTKSSPMARGVEHTAPAAQIGHRRDAAALNRHRLIAQGNLELVGKRQAPVAVLRHWPSRLRVEFVVR